MNGDYSDTDSETAEFTHEGRGKLIENLRKQSAYPTRIAFSKKYGISDASLKHWEGGSGKISLFSLKKLVDAFQREGVVCNEEYILNGGTKEKGNAEKETEMEMDANIKTELAFFYKQYKNADHVFINDDTMRPFLKKGDVVVGLKHKLDQIRFAHGKLCIINTVNNLSYVKFIEKTNLPNIICMRTGNNSDKFSFLLNLAEVLYFAPVIWIKSIEEP